MSNSSKLLISILITFLGVVVVISSPLLIMNRWPGAIGFYGGFLMIPAGLIYFSIIAFAIRKERNSPSAYPHKINPDNKDT